MSKAKDLYLILVPQYVSREKAHEFIKLGEIKDGELIPAALDKLMNE